MKLEYADAGSHACTCLIRVCPESALQQVAPPFPSEWAIEVRSLRRTIPNTSNLQIRLQYTFSPTFGTEFLVSLSGIELATWGR